MRYLLVLLTLLASTVSLGADITITAPTSKLQPGAYVILQVQGIDMDSLPKASVEVIPSDAVILPARTWGGSPIIIFSAPKAGTYTLSVHVNRWKKVLVDSLASVEAAEIDPPLFASLKDLIDEIDRAYPASSGTCVLEVAGPNPQPEPDPKPQPKPDPVLKGKRVILGVYETSNTTPGLSAFLVRLRDDPEVLKYLKANSHQLMLLDKNTRNELNQPSPLLKRYLEQAEAQFPRSTALDHLLIISNPQITTGSTVVHAGELPVPTSPRPEDVQEAIDKFLELLKQAGG